MSTAPMTEKVSEKLKALAKDLTKEPPRSPRETLAGTQGEYKFNGFMDSLFFSFTEISPEKFTAFVATGASDDEMAEWITAHAKPRERIEIVKWNNHGRYRKVREMPERFQAFMEDYIAKHVPKHRPVIHVFDIFDLEEGRL